MKQTNIHFQTTHCLTLLFLSIFMFSFSFNVDAQLLRKNKKNKEKTEISSGDKNLDQKDSEKKTNPSTKPQLESSKQKPSTNSGIKEKPQEKTLVENTEKGSDNNEGKYKPIVETFPNGKVDWTDQYVEAKGMSVIDNERFKNPAQAKLMARRGAIVDAQRNLLEIVKGVRVVSETKVVDMMTESDYILTQIDGVLKNAEMIGEAVEKEGIIEVRMRVPIYKQEGLASALHPKVGEKGQKTSMGMKEIKFLEGNPEEIKIEDMSELVFNFNGKEYSPSMFPIVLDENNNVLLDFSKYYDPKTGKFPKLLAGSKEILEAAGSKKGAQIIDVIESFDGKIKIDNSKISKKINWQKIGKVATSIGKIAVSLIL
ncbi:MAG: hypothetical protein PHI36_02530 [Bacteroidales bacterium]|nr:hypothetical protein [Bacteroidales bacterium]